MFYGWPTPGQASVSSIQEIGMHARPFDIYASAHAVYSPEKQGSSVCSAFVLLCFACAAGVGGLGGWGAGGLG